MILKQIEEFRIHSEGLKVVINQYCNTSEIKKGKKPEELLISFIRGVYENFTKTIRVVEETLQCASNSVDSKAMKKTISDLKEFLAEYEEVFIKTGVAEEHEVRKNKEMVILFLSKLPSFSNSNNQIQIEEIADDQGFDATIQYH